MSKPISKLEAIRQDGRTQVDSQRTNILDAAEKLFLEQGLEHTSMRDIAAGAGITRMSLYRYFPDLHPIAFEIAARMLAKVTAVIDTGGQADDLETIKRSILRMIDRFPELRDAYRYLGMFDHLYGTSYPNEALAAWYKEQIFSLGWIQILARQSAAGAGIHPGQIAMIGNNTLSFLEKMAVRGELMAAEQGVSLEEQLTFFKDMIQMYLERSVQDE
jgi:AcrR family transcriptional regulator